MHRMEDTYALLSKLVQTKSIERVLAPIAAQVSQLIIINEAYEQGHTDAFPADLVPSATIVRASTQGLVDAASRLAYDTSDKELHGEMPRACELLSVSGQSLVMATQRVQVEDFSRESRRHLIRTAKDVLQGTLKVLLVTDDAEIRKIKKSIQWTRDRLGILTAVNTMKNLVPAFKGFTESVMLLTNLVDKRQLDLSHPQQREAVLNALAILKKCVPMLNTSMQTYTKYPQNPQAKASKLYVVGQIMGCLEALEGAIHSKDLVSEEYEEPEMPGFFVTNVDRMIEMLSADRRTLLAQMGTDLDFVMEALVRHSMEVSHLSTEHHRSLIIKNAQRLLKQRTQLSEMSKNVQDNPSMTALRADFEDACERLIEEVQDLERHVHGAVLQLVVDVFKETTEPLDRMVKAALSNHNVAASSAGLDAFIELFHQHSDKMMHVARLTAATSLDAKKVRTINTCVSHLERLDPEIVPATMACQDAGQDGAALGHLRLLKKEWGSTVDVLVQVLDELVDGKMFIEISESEIRGDISKCKESLYSEEAAVAEVTRSLIGLSRRVSQRATRTVDSHIDALYRNGVMAYINLLNKAIPAVKSAANCIVEDLGDLQNHKTFHRRCDLVLKYVGQVKDALLGNMLPDLLDPIRDNVRPLRGIGTLDLESESDEEDHHLPTTTSSSSAAAAAAACVDDLKISRRKPVHEIVAERKAIKTYISDIVHSHIAELMQSITSAAVGGQQKKLDALCNSVLTISNHLTEIGTMVAKHCSEQQKRILTEGAQDLVMLTPQILDKSRKVSECDTYELDPLNTITSEWSQTVSALESCTDAVLAKWKSVSDKLIDAARMANVPLLLAQKKHFEEHSQQVSSLVRAALDLVDRADPFTREKVALLRDNADEFENLTTMLVTMTDLNVNSGPTNEEKLQLEHAGREWAAKVYSITSSVDVLSADAIHSFRGKPLEFKKADFTELNVELASITTESMRLKKSIDSVLNACSDDDRLIEGRSHQRALDELCGKVHECSQLVTHVAAPYQTTEKMYAPHSMSLILWQWASKVNDTHAMINKWTCDFCQKMGTFIDNVKALHRTGSTDDSQQAAEISCRRFVTYFRETFLKCRSKVLDAIQTSDDLDGKNSARRHLEDMGSIADDVEKAAKDLIGSLHTEKLMHFEDTRRRWGIKCLEISACLHGLQGANKRSITDAIQSMKLQEESPKVKATYSPGFHINKYDKNATSSTSNITNGGTTGKRNVVSEELSATMWLSEESSENSPRPNSAVKGILKHRKNSAQSVKRTVSFESSTPGSFRNSPAAETSWKELSAGPRAQHGTPVRPSDRSGYKPTSKALGGSYSPFNYPVEAEKWEDENNAIVKVAREVTKQLTHMTEYTKGQGPIVSKEQLISTAKQVASNGEKLVKFAKVLVAHSVDKRVADDLQCSADRMPTVIAQLNILASVKAAAPEDRSTEKMLVKTAGNLVEAINKMLRNAETTCVKGIRQPDGPAADETQALVLATQWRRRFNRHRLMEYSSTTVDDLGLRKVNHQAQAPALSQILMHR